MSWARFSGTVGSGWWAGKVPSMVSFSSMCRPGSRAVSRAMTRPAEPLPASQPTRSPGPSPALLGEARDIGILDSGLGDRTPALDKVTRSGERAERADALAEKGFARQHHLEAVYSPAGCASR